MCLMCTSDAVQLKPHSISVEALQLRLVSYFEGPPVSPVRFAQSDQPSACFNAAQRKPAKEGNECRLCPEHKSCILLNDVCTFPTLGFVGVL